MHDIELRWKQEGKETEIDEEKLTHFLFLD